MEFIPTWKDYGILLQFVGLFGVSGWLTYRLSVGQPRDLDGLGEAPGGGGDAFRSLINPALLSIICGLVPSSFLLVFCAQLGFFRIRFLFLLLAVYSLVCFAYLLKSGRLQWRLPRLRRLRFGWGDLWLLGILALGLFTFGKPSEYVPTHRDPGEYVNIAVRLAQEQALRFTDPDYQDFDADRQKLFLPVPLDQALHLEPVPGFSLVDPKSGEMLPQYLHLFPLWLALAFKLWRFDGLFGLNVVLGLLSLLIVVSLAVEVFRSKTVGLLASTLLCLNLGQIWLVRSPFSEVLVQVFLLAGIWILALAVSRRQASLGFLSGLVFGLTLLVRIDSMLAVLAVLSFLILARSGVVRSGAFSVWPFLMGLGLSLAYALVHVTLFAYPYVSVILFNLGLFHSSLNEHWGWFVALALLTIALIWRWRLLVDSMRGWKKRSAAGSRVVRGFTWNSATWRMNVFLGLSGLATLAFAYGYFLRPWMASGDDLLPLPPPHQGTVRFYDELNLVRLGWYLSPLGFFLAYVGGILAVRQVVLKRQIRPALFLLVLGVFLLFYGYKSRAFPDNYWVIRRYAEIVIPGLLILAALAIQRLHRMASCWLATTARSRTCRLLLRTCSLGLLIVLVTRQTVVAWPFFREGEFGATLKQMEVLASQMVEADVILFEYGIAQQFFLGPLRNLFRQSVFPLAHDKPDPAAFERVVGGWMAEGRAVFLVACEERTSLRSSKYVFEPKERFYFSSRLVEQTYERLPKGMKDVRYSLQIYEVGPRPQELSKPSVALYAHSSFGYASTGFYQAESGVSQNVYRWSRGDASVELPEIDASQPAVLIARLARPAIGVAAKSPVRVRLNGHDLSPIQLSRRFKDYKFPVAESQLARGKNNLVEFLSDSFNPLASQAGEDSRDLGFMLDCVKLQAAPVPVTGFSSYQVDFDTECAGIQTNDFYPTEGAGFAWTGLSPSLIFPVPIDTRQTCQFVVLRAVKSSPYPEYRQFLTVWVNEVELGTKEMFGAGDQFREYSFAIPPSALDLQPAVIRFRVRPTWNPSLAGEALDYRNLGCAVQWIRVEGRDAVDKRGSAEQLWCGNG